MSIVAIIPARGGSKGIPGKNLKRVGGVPLVVRAVQTARASARIDRVIVTTDDALIAAAAKAAGAELVLRPAALAGDVASSESALLHVLDELRLGRLAADAAAGLLPSDPQIVVFIQATSPFIDPADIDTAIDRVRRGTDDVVFSAVKTHAFLWRQGTDGAAGVNHDASVRPMRQQREPHFRETGAFYVLGADGFERAGFRFFGRVGMVVVDERCAIDIDTPADLSRAAAIAPLHGTPCETAPIDVDAVVTDFDGVHTDDRVQVGADGSERVTVSRSDGMGVRLLREAGIPVLILSTEVNPVVAARARKLQVEVIQGQSDKAAALRTWASEHGLDLERIAYLGNDLNDLGCLTAVGWPVSVPGAKPEVLAAARLVLEAPGGHGAVRELAEKVLRSRRPHDQENLEERETPWLYPSAARQ